MFSPIPSTLQFNNLISNIEQGFIKVPQFQRKFVWDKEQSAKLLDSILKGYPIGTFIIWETDEKLRSIRNIGGFTFPVTPDGHVVQYVLDGQQRITSLYASMKGAKITDDDGKLVDYSEIYVDFEAKSDEQIVITDISGKDTHSIIKFSELMNGGFSLANKYPQYLEKLENYSNSFKCYLFSTILVKGVSIDIATEIFTRINIGGKALSVFEIMVAKTYDADRSFDLYEQYEKLVEKLELVNYETISSSTILQAVSVCLVNECTKKQILNLDKNKFIDEWQNVVNAFENAVDYFRSFFRIPVSQLLPYDGLLVPFTYFFYLNKKKPTGHQIEYLQDYFWRVVMNSRYSNALETKIGQDIKRIDLILKNLQPTYDEPVDISTAYIENHGWFATGTAYIKGFLCLLAYQQPLSFLDNSIVNIDNSWLKQANSKNYHHFFPKAYLAKRNYDSWKINHIANITIVDDFLNKRSIRDRAPSNYMAEFQANNSQLDKALKSHLIGDMVVWGITTDDYDTFFRNRLLAFNNELKKRIIISSIDKY